MPLYEYEYLKADGTGSGHKFETFQHMSAPHLTACPTTGKPCRRCVTAPANGNLAFTEKTGESRMHFFHPDEVNHFRRELKTNAIKDDGRVIFNDRQEQRSFQKSYDDWDARNNPRKKSKVYDPKKKTKRT